MKKVLYLSCLLIIVSICFTSCACKHEWKEATCVEPKTCSLCEETEGEALGHNWQDATCTKAVTCSVCKETAGNPLGHSWKKATCTKPKTCTKCKETKGEAEGHDWQDATYDAPKTCASCGKTEGYALEVPVTYESYDEESYYEDESYEEEYYECRLCSSECYEANGTRSYYCYGHMCHAPGCFMAAQGDLGYCPTHVRDYLPDY